MSGSGSPIGMTRSTIAMRPIGIHKVPTKKGWFARFAEDPGIVRPPISPQQHAGVADSHCRLTAQDSAVPVVSSPHPVNSQETAMLGGGIRLTVTDCQRPVLYSAEVTLNSARRHPLRQAGPLVIEGPVSLASWKLCKGQFPLSTGERSASWI